jgi:hypothetical protein
MGSSRHATSGSPSSRPRQRAAAHAPARHALFVNGLPLVLIELKNPADLNAGVWKAFHPIQTYKAQKHLRHLQRVGVAGSVARQHVGVGQARQVTQARRRVGAAAHWRWAELESAGRGRIDEKARHGQLRLKGRHRRASLSMSPWHAPGVESMQAPARRTPSPGAAVALCLRTQRAPRARCTDPGVCQRWRRCRRLARSSSRNGNGLIRPVSGFPRGTGWLMAPASGAGGIGSQVGTADFDGSGLRAFAAPSTCMGPPLTESPGRCQVHERGRHVAEPIRASTTTRQAAHEGGRCSNGWRDAVRGIGCRHGLGTGCSALQERPARWPAGCSVQLCEGEPTFATSGVTASLAQGQASRGR